MNIKKLGVCFVVAMLMVSFVMGSVSINAYAEENKKIGIGNLTEDDLVAAWYFDEDSGDVVKDYKDNYNGTVNGTAVIETNYGKGRRFDGIDDKISFNNPVIPLGEKTIRFRFRKNDIPKDQNQYLLINCTNGNTQNGIDIEVCRNGAIGIGLHKASEGTIILIGSKNICDGKWHEILFTWDGTTSENKVKLYVDNMLTTTQVTKASSRETTKYGADLMLGYCSSQSSKTIFKGDLDEIEVFNKYYMPPSAPTNLIATAGNKKVELLWDPVEGVESYIVKRSTTKGGPYKEIGETKETSYTDSGLDNGTTYYYVVCAVKNGVKSPDSNEASATPEGSSSSGDNVLLRITMLNGTINEYDLSMSDVEDFIDWFEDRDDPYYIIEKDYNIGPFESRKDYIVADKILQFEVMEYND